MTPSVWQALDNTSAISPHPSRQAWDRFCLEEASAQERTRLQLHLSECVRCQSSVQLIRLEQSAFAQSLPRLAFLHAISTQTTPSLAVGHGGGLGWLRWGGWLGSVGACGLLLLWLGSVGDPKEIGKSEPLGSEAAPFSKKRPIIRHDGELWRKKGGGPLLEVFLSRKGVQALARSGASFYAGDQLGFRYQGAGYGFLTLVLVDAKGAVSWLYPSSAAPSIPIAAQGRLQDAVELDSSLGQERIIAFFAQRPLSAKRILAALPFPKEGAQKLATDERVFVRSFLLEKK